MFTLQNEKHTASQCTVQKLRVTASGIKGSGWCVDKHSAIFEWPTLRVVTVYPSAQSCHSVMDTECMPAAMDPEPVPKLMSLPTLPKTVTAN